jgi:pimeloyl-ACP methyl ester carboxylesterase
MDATSYNADGTVSSANFELIAETLPQDGIAVLRFNKRGVLGSGEYDTAQINTSSLDRLVADANAVVDTALTLEQVDTDRIYLYGWSEGAWVVSNVAAGRDDIVGLILQGASDGSLETELPYQLQEIFLNYVTETADADGDGALSLEEIAAIEGGSVLTWRNYFLLDQTSTLPDGLVVNTFVDQNGDELIDIESELEPMLDMFITNYGLYAPEVDASYETAELIAEMDMPVLLLHGEMDGWIEFANAEVIQEAAPERVTLQAYPELGHALSPTSELAADVLGEMDAAPLEDVAAWILSQE